MPGFVENFEMYAKGIFSDKDKAILVFLILMWIIALNVIKVSKMVAPELTEAYELATLISGIVILLFLAAKQDLIIGAAAVGFGNLNERIDFMGWELQRWQMVIVVGWLIGMIFAFQQIATGSEFSFFSAQYVVPQISMPAAEATVTMGTTDVMTKIGLTSFGAAFPEELLHVVALNPTIANAISQVGPGLGLFIPALFLFFLTDYRLIALVAMGLGLVLLNFKVGRTENLLLTFAIMAIISFSTFATMHYPAYSNLCGTYVTGGQFANQQDCMNEALSQIAKFRIVMDTIAIATLSFGTSLIGHALMNGIWLATAFKLPWWMGTIPALLLSVLVYAIAKLEKVTAI